MLGKKLHNEEHYNLSFLQMYYKVQFKKNKKGWTRCEHGKMRGMYKILIGKPERKIQP
jgi:hypothetical protein